MTITKIPSLRTMSSKTFSVLDKINRAPMPRTGLGHGADEWTSKIIDNLAAAGYIKREASGLYAITGKGRRTVQDTYNRTESLDRIARSCIPGQVAASARFVPHTPAGYNPCPWQNQPSPRAHAGADDFLAVPSREFSGLVYRKDAGQEAA